MNVALPDAILQSLSQLADAFGGPSFAVEPCQAGFSRARVSRVRFRDTSLALRCWGWGQDREAHLQAVLQYQRRLAERWCVATSLYLPGNAEAASDECPIPMVIPWLNGSDVVVSAGSLWSLAQWMNGAAWRGHDADYPLGSVLECLAKMHAISLEANVTKQPSVNWAQRLQQLESLCPVRGLAASKPLVSRLNEIISEVLQSGLQRCLLEVAREHSKRQYPVVWIPSDVHRDNVLFKNGRVSGIVDFGAARVDWMGWDVIRLLTSLDIVASAQATQLEAYTNLLSEECSYCATTQRWLADCIDSLRPWHDAQLLLRIDQIQTLLAMRRWCEWMANEECMAEGAEQRIDWLVKHWDTLC